MIEHLANRHGLLAARTELRPDFGDRGLVAEKASIDNDMSDRRGGSLDDREVVEGRVVSDQPTGRRVGHAGNGFDQRFAVVVDGDLDTPFLS